MLYFANWKVLLICAVCALGVIASIPNLFSAAQLAHLPSFVPHRQVALGLDLRGGSYLLLEVDVAAAQKDRLNSIVDTVRNTLRDTKIGYTGLNVEEDAIVFTIRDADRIDDARQALAKLDPELTVDIAADGTGSMKFGTVATESRRRQAVEQSIEIIRRRIDETGTKEPTIQRQGQDRILVELPGVDHVAWIGEVDILLAEIQEFVTGVRPASEVDRIVATVLFVDIVGSTERAAALGDARWRDLMDRGSRLSQRVSNYDQCSLNIRMI